MPPVASRSEQLVRPEAHGRRVGSRCSCLSASVTWATTFALAHMSRSLRSSHVPAELAGPHAASSSSSPSTRATGSRRVARRGSWRSRARRRSSGSNLIGLLEEDDRVERIVAIDIEPAARRRQEDALLRRRSHAAGGRGAPRGDPRGRAASTRSCTSRSLVAPATPTAWAHELESVGTMHVLGRGAPRAGAQARALVADAPLRRAPVEPEFPHREAPAPRDDARAVLRRQDRGRGAGRAARASGRPEPSSRSCAPRRSSGPTVRQLRHALPRAQARADDDGLRPARAVRPRGRRHRRVQARRRSRRAGHVQHRRRRACSRFDGHQARGPRRACRSRTRRRDADALGWVAQLAPAPPTFLKYLRFLCVADGAKARDVHGLSRRRTRRARRCSTS